MLITDWWSQNGPFASWLPAEMRAELLECSGDNIQSLPEDLRALLEVFSVFQSADYQKTISMLDSHLFSGRAEMLLPVIRARICAQTGDYASAVRELQFAEKLGFHSGLVSYTSRVLLGMQVDSHGSAAQLGGSWEEILGDSIHSLPTDLQTLCLRSAHSPGLRMTGQHISLLCINLDIIQEEYAFALDAIEHRYPKSDYKGSLFLLRARVLAELSRFDEMLLCLQGAAELCGGDDSFQTTFNELSNRMLTHTRPDGISLQLKRGLAVNDFRSMPIGSARIRENESRTNQIASDKGSCLTRDADKISECRDRYDQLQFEGRTLLIPKSFYFNYLNLGAPEVTVFCAVWSKDKNKDVLLRSHSLNLRKQTRTVFPLYIFDDGDVPEDFGMPHVVCLDPLTIYEAWNLAVKLAPTEYVLNLNLDDRLFSNSIALMKDFLEASDSDLVGGEWLIDFGSPRQCIDDLRVEVSQTAFSPEWPPREDKNLRLGSGTGERGTYGPATMWKRSTTGMGYPNLFRNGEQIRSIGDALFWHSLKQAGRTLKKMPLLIGLYHSDASSQAEFRSHNDHEHLKGGWLWKA